MRRLTRLFAVLSMWILIASACSVLPGAPVVVSPLAATPLILPTLGHASADAGNSAPTIQPLPTQAQPTASPMPAVQPPVVAPQPVATQAPVQIITPVPGSDLNAFSAALAAAVEARDFVTLRALMRDRFAIATWDSSLNVIASDDAIQSLGQDRLAPGSQPAVRFGADIVQLLSGADPVALWGPVDQVVRAVHVMGLGSLANDEAVIVIGRDPATGSYYFHGILVPPGGNFTFQPADVVTGTPVEAVVALDYLNVRSGPGLNYAVEGAVRAGEIAIVTGVSLDGNWWQIRCVQDSSGFCWISADPSLSQPTARP